MQQGMLFVHLEDFLKLDSVDLEPSVNMVTVSEPKKVAQTLEEVADNRAAMTEPMSMEKFLIFVIRTFSIASHLCRVMINCEQTKRLE
jgi:hypothetical protein